jgi:hypothetical protein
MGDRLLVDRRFLPPEQFEAAADEFCPPRSKLARLEMATTPRRELSKLSARFWWIILRTGRFCSSAMARWVRC